MKNIFKKNKNIDFQNQEYQAGDTDSRTQPSNAPQDINIDHYKADIKGYKDPVGLSERKMNIGLWLVANRKNFHFLIVGFLLLIIFFAWGVFIFTFSRHIFFDMKADKEALLEIVKHNLEFFNFLQDNPVKDLTFGNVESIKIADDRYDFFAKISNPNEKYWAHFDYVFLVNGVKTKKASGFILPAETKYVVLLGENVENNFGSLNFIIEKIDWQRLDRERHKDWKSFAADHLDITTDNTNFVSAQSSSLSEKISINSLDFTATNNTAYNYWETSFITLLFNNNKIVGVNRYTTNRFMSGQTQNIGITWPENINRVSNILIIPEVDITRDDAYIKFDGGIGAEK